MTLGLAPAAASGAVIAVNTYSDVSVDDSECSLREAVASANANDASGSGCQAGEAAQQDIINLPAGNYALVGADDDDANLTGDLDYTGGGQVAIQGPAAPFGVPLVTIDAPPSDRIFDVPAPVGSPRQLLLGNMALTDGRALGTLAEGDGGAVRIEVPNVDFQASAVKITDSRAARNGGAISFHSANEFGRLDISDSELSGNQAGVQSVQGSGGAIWTGVDMNAPMVSRTTLAGNAAAAMGGALALNAGLPTPPVIKFRNSTLSGNTSGQGGNAVGFVGSGGSSSAFFEFSTIADNTSPTSHGALESVDQDQAVYLRASILAGNTGAGAPSNCAGVGQVTTQGYNIEAADTCGLLPASTDKVNTDPLLAPLAITTDVGAFRISRTHGLYDGSPAIDFVPRTPIDACAAEFTDGVDQRNISRPSPSEPCDAGAFEGTVGPKPTPSPLPDAIPSPIPEKCKKGFFKKKGKCVKKKRKKKKRKK